MDSRPPPESVVQERGRLEHTTHVQPTVQPTVRTLFMGIALRRSHTVGAWSGGTIRAPWLGEPQTRDGMGGTHLVRRRTQHIVPARVWQ
jgi:hypothetical protein